MALIKCNECGKMVSDKATKCPHCGYPLKSNVTETTDELIPEKESNGMKRALIAVLLCLLVGGGGYFAYSLLKGDGTKEVKKFAIKFAEIVSKNQVDLIRAIYPDATLADSLALTFVEDSIKIERNEKDASILIHYSSEIWVRAMKDENDSIRIVSSKGLFAYPTNLLAIAKKTGQYVDSLDDKGNAERMADKQFQEYMVKKVKEKIKESLKIVSTKGFDYAEGEGGMMEPLGFIATVENQSDITIEGKVYKVVIADTGFDNENLRDVTNYHPLAGNDIKPGEKIPFKYRAQYVGASFKANIQIQDIGNDLLTSYKTTGNEYKEYLEKKSAK